ncbi:MAG: response regulator [Ruminococcus sp.]|nr:response regulator [Ruminococcus sp.]
MKKMKKRWYTLVLLVNFIIVFMIIGICYIYTENLQKRYENDTKNNFTNIVSSIRKTAGEYLITQKQFCNSWASYIALNDMAIDEAINFLNTINSAEGVMAHIVDYDTMTGYSTVPDSNGNYMIDYSDHKEEFLKLVEEMKSNPDVTYITHAYNNPIDANSVVGFCCGVEIDSENHYILIRVVPLSNITDQWVFPSDYEDAELSLIDLDGNYIIRSDSMVTKNFWEFIKIHNNLNDDEIEDMKESISLKSVYFGELVNNENQGSYIVSMPSIQAGNWYYVGYVSKNSVTADLVDFTLVFILTIGFIVMLIFNGAYFLSINRQLRKSAEETRRANQAKTQFLSSMSHDIRTPMNAIIGMTALSLKHINDPDYIRESLKKITLASNHLLTLINDILDISKVESGKLSLNPTIFSLEESITNLVNIARPQIKEKGQEFNIHINKIRYEYLFADELRLNQIFINLLTNAVKYTPNGGKINLDLSERLADESGKTIILTYIVSDNGIGMSEEFQKTMYETFARAADSRIDKIQGSGLGLAITKQMVELMNGTIECKSELGKGTSFTVTVELPIGEKLTDELMLPPMKILIADDDNEFLETAVETLESLGVSADTAESGKTAIKMAIEKHEKSNDYPVAIIDWKMPEMSGIETIRQMREKVGNEIPIIVISAYDWTEIEEEAIEAGANGFINKPFFRSAVYSTMSEILSIKNAPEISAENPSDGLSGIHLLIAEDNDLNWEIIEEILDGFDITCERAENGKIAVEMLSENHNYDAVLMDVQMPVMNGREATRAIRELDDEKLRNIPIIAMTADAFAEDIQSCFEAGMNGHVAKPIDVKKIFDELHKAGVSDKKKS